MLNIKNINIRTAAFILLFFAIILISFGSVSAENIRGENVLVESDRRLKKTSFLSGENVSMDGNINGTTFVSTENKVTLSFFSFDTLIKVILSTLAPLVVWIFVKLIRPTFWIKLTEDQSDSPFKIIGFGILSLIFVPILSILLIIINIGIPLGLILLALYLITNYISKIILSLFITYWLKNKYDWSSSQEFWIFLLGMIILTILDLIPMVGWFFSLIIVSFGHGSIILSLKKYHKNNKFSFGLKALN